MYYYSLPLQRRWEVWISKGGEYFYGILMEQIFSSILESGGVERAYGQPSMYLYVNSLDIYALDNI